LKATFNMLNAGSSGFCASRRLGIAVVRRGGRHLARDRYHVPFEAERGDGGAGEQRQPSNRGVRHDLGTR
jgi:hypothetical protein